MLCTFKKRHENTWMGYQSLPFNEHAKPYHKKIKIIKLSTPFVTILEKRGSKFMGFWVSFSKVLATNEHGVHIKVWVMSEKLKPANKNYFNNQSNDL